MTAQMEKTMNLKKILVFLWILIMSFQNFTYSQNEGDKLSVATYRKIYSNILNEERTIAVSLPAGYENSLKRYPVFYILDAEDTGFAWQIGIARNLSPERIPETIIVGVVNTDRIRDFMSWKMEGLPSTKDDGAPNFLNYLSQELIPFIDRNYRTTPHRTIYGGSAAGHFVTFSLLENPKLFEVYLDSSPVIGFSNNQLLTKAEAFFNRHKSLKKSFFIYFGKTDYNSVVKRIPLLESIISKNTPGGFKWGIKSVEGRHVPPESFSELLLMNYSGWQPVNQPVITPAGGEFLRGKSISVQISNDRDPVHFSLNGEEPTRNFPVYNGPVRINKPTIIKAKTIRGDLQESGTVSAQFTIVSNLRPAQKVSNPRSGLKYKYIEQQSFNTPDSITGMPVKSGIIPSVDLSVCERDQFYLIQYNGFIKIPSSGQYRFTLTYTDCKFFIDNSLIIAGGGLLPRETSREICLEAGYHAMRIISCILTQPNDVLELYWEGPGIKKQRIHAGAFYY